MSVSGEKGEKGREVEGLAEKGRKVMLEVRVKQE